MTSFKLDFMGKRRLAMIISAVLLAISIAAIILRGLNLGIDFTGGTLVEVGYQQATDLTSIREILSDSSDFAGASVQKFGTAKDVLIRLAPVDGVSNADLSNKLMETLNSDDRPEAELRRVEFVGPQVGEELTQDGGLAMLYAIFGILIYVALRFEYRFALGAVVALVHDVIITIGFFALFGKPFDLTVLAAILAVIGYSLNDTIVVYDRIRENFRLLKALPEEIMNESLNQTLSRTLMTSVTTLLVLIALALLGGEIIHYFALALIVGVVIGTYSSIYVASPVLLAMGVSREDMIIPEVEGAEVDEMP